VQKSYTSVAKRVFNSVETQTMFTWFENMEKTTRLTVKPKEKIPTPSHKTSSSSQTASTSVKTSILQLNQKM
jgi:mannose-6-phosphate isomerase-like protein (cupin superfamily)